MSMLTYTYACACMPGPGQDVQLKIISCGRILLSNFVQLLWTHEYDDLDQVMYSSFSLALYIQCIIENRNDFRQCARQCIYNIIHVVQLVGCI